ncbi:sporulation histidine kinase inhibitor Sda [Salipaludibacillus sp. LMS25]|uniref:sporulation histidine kinase inhibitor Sda n=1 Tax=Salipaludibacillus sp. LMS25 TaxID=2924031 RepID=UPI0020D0A550|nr:sporulation histidine kinase inhibitor Sda [Salipaludibacillus sp. LMS25]UTR14741.1 sporulation histidine kinase inhibitor Sda [Salipaludibacillus sp. LMS25]
MTSSIKRLNSDQLLEVYTHAKELGLETDFIEILENELQNRKMCAKNHISPNYREISHAVGKTHYSS